MNPPYPAPHVSLRLRILLLFLGFAVLPVILLGAGDYLQSVSALRMVIDARGEGLAVQTAREIDQAYLNAEAALQSAASELASRGLPAAVPDGGAVPGLALEELAPFSEVVLLRGDEQRFRTRREAGAGRSCAVPGERVAVEIPVPGHDDARLVGLTSVGRLLEGANSLNARLGRAGFTRVVERGTGIVVFDSRCEGVGGPGGPELGAADGADRLLPGSPVGGRYEDDDGVWHAATAGAEAVGFDAVVVSSDAEFVTPFRSSRLAYLGVALLILAGAAFGFTLLARRSFRSLRALTAAADQIEIGNMRPWLPPPGEDEIGRLTVAFRKMVERLSDSIRQAELNQKLAAVGELASYLSHEIRNPLSSIRLSLQSLHRDLSAGFIPGDADRIIQIALGEVKRLDGVVRTVLEVGRQPRSEGGRTCSVHESLEETLDVIRPKARAQMVELELVPRADPDLVRADPEGLRGVWINLLVNAMDALDGTPGGRIRISTWTGPAAAGELHVRFADNGPGVPPDVVESIFEPFFTTKLRGNGIGLPTALRTVQPWGGTISYEPVAAGRGAVFVVKLRLADPRTDRDRPPEHPELEPALPERAAP